MQFGVKVKDAPTSSNSGGGGRFIKYFKKGETTIRFLEEIDEWTKYYEHYSPSLSRTYPCTGDRETCPGCTSDNPKEANASCRYLTNALDPKTGYVDLWKVPVSIIDDLRRYSGLDNGITQRHYTVIQFQSEGKIKYSVDKEEKDDRPVSDFEDKFQDHQKSLMEAYTDAWGDPGDESSPVQSPSKRPSKPKEEEGWKTKPEDDKPPFDQAEDEEVIDEEEIRKMDAEQLKDLFRRSGLRVPRTNNEDALRDILLESLGV